MSENRLRYYGCDEILEFLDGTYFHPSRDKEFPSPEIKYAAQCALLRLWNIAPILSSILKSQMTDIERNLSEMIFKLAVEVAKQNHIAACRGELDEDTLYRLNDLCCRDVASNNGRVQFENAYRYQNRYDEDGDE